MGGVEPEPDAGGIATFRRALDALRSGDLDELLSVGDPEVRIVSLLVEAEGGRFRGHDGLRKWFEAQHEVFDRIEPELVRVVEDGPRFIAELDLKLHGAASGVDVGQRIFSAGATRGGRLFSLGFYRTLEEARTALSEVPSGSRAAVVTISTSLANGEGDDVSGPALLERCAAAGLEVSHETVADDREAIVNALKRLADEARVRFVFTTGGTGLTPDDVTPEATREVIDREAPGYAETMRAESRAHTPLGIVARGVSGIRGRTLIINFPGNPKAIDQLWPIVEPTLDHAAETLERD